MTFQYALGVTALAALAGCSGVGSFAIARSVGDRSPLVTRGAVAAIDVDHGKSWMEPNGGKGPLLYVSDAGTNDVVVYHYPSGREAGVLTGFDEPQGECVDKAGNVWIANTLASKLLEYAHGGTTPIATLADPGQYPVDCSIDRNDGTLAATNIIARKGRDPRGSLSIYPNAVGSPTIVASPDFYLMYSLGYDDKDNLFLDGRNNSDAFQFGELAGGSSKINPITLSGATINFPGGVRFAKRRVNVGDQAGAVVYEATEAGTVTGSVPLSGSSDCVDFSIHGHALICPDAGNGEIEIYKYPAGGSPIQVITGLVSPTGAAVSSH
jgi:hypothetical protein